LRDCPNIRGQYRENRTKGLYQWLTHRASFFRSVSSESTASRTVRTEVTVERHGTTVVMGGAAAAFDTCPLCGSKLAPDKAEPAQQERLRLPEGAA